MSDIILNFHFIRPYWLGFMIPAIVVASIYWVKQSRANQWHALIDKNLLPFLIDNQSGHTLKLPIIGLVIIWILGSIAMAGPTWTKQPQPVKESVSALVVLWDLSPSMNAQDITPSRLSRSRLKLIDLLNTRKEGLTGLIAYSGEAHVVTPLTDDTQTIISLLSGLSPEVMPVAGSNPEMAFTQAHQLLKDSNIDKGDILFLTDGIPYDAESELQDIQGNSPHRVTIWSIGTKQGAPIPLPNGSFVKDSRNQIIVAQLKERELSNMAIALNGLYVPYSNDDLDIRTINGFSAQADNSATRETTREFDLWVEYGPYLLLLCLPLIALSFRRGWVLGIFYLAMITPDEVQAISWEDLWQTKDQKAQKALRNGDTATAADTFKNPDWKAIADYKNNNYEDAKAHFEKGEGAEDAYNLGNTLAHAGDYDGALKAYDKALEKNPNLTEAQDNKQVVEKLKQLQQAQNNQQSNQGDSSENSEDGQKQEGQQQEGQQKSGDQQDGQQQEGQQQQSQQGEQNQNDEQSDSSSEEQAPQSQSEPGEEENNEQASQSKAEEQSSSEEEQQALENQYGQQQEEQDAEESKNSLEQDKNSEEESEQQAQQIAEQDGDQQQGDELTPEQIAELQQMKAQTEQQQALEQWLRKVPDDPSRLMRNKFLHESRVRRQKNQQTLRRPPSSRESERW